MSGICTNKSLLFNFHQRPPQSCSRYFQTWPLHGQRLQISVPVAERKKQ
jgi:hypothetical protein